MTNSPGVYLITCTVTNKRYVGCSKDIRKRWAWHRYHLKMNKHHNQHLQRAYNKYGPDAFVYTILELTEKVSCFERETYYIESLKPEYNMLKNDYTSADGWLHNEADEAYVEEKIAIDPMVLFFRRDWLTEDELIALIDNGRQEQKGLNREERALRAISWEVQHGYVSQKKLIRLCKEVGWTYQDYCDKLALLPNSL